MEKKLTEQVHRILIVEDDINVAERLSVYVSKHAELSVVGIAYDVQTGLDLLSKLKPRIVLVDLGLPDGFGVQILQAIHRANWKCEAIVISVFDDEDQVFEAIRAGAKGYILKQDLKEAVNNQIIEVVEGGSPINPKIARLILQHVPADHSPGLDRKFPSLTARETEILKKLSKGHRRQEIARELEIAIGTVGVHINRIYQKFGVRSNVEAVKLFTASKKE